jgi:flagellin
MNANEAMRKNVSGLKKQTEKLSTGYNINRAADNAAGLAISEKMRSQIRGLTQASANANDAISLIQTAEGGLQETEDIMQRMRELAVQSANGTYTDEDRQQIQYEVDALKAEVDRIAESTEFNEMKLLDGSLSNTSGVKSGDLGPKFSGLNTADIANLGITKDTVMFTADKAGVSLKMGSNKAVEEGNEVAVWNAAGTELTITLATNTTYTEERLNEIINNAQQEGSTATANPANAKITLKGDGDFASITTNGTDLTPAAVAGCTTVAGKQGESTATSLGTAGTDVIGADKIKLIANKYGKDMNDEITLSFDADDTANKHDLEVTQTTASSLSAGSYTAGKYTLHLKVGKEYTEEDIAQALQKAGLDYSVELTGPDAAEAKGEETLKAINTAISDVAVTVAGGTGYSADDADKLSVGALVKNDSVGKVGGGLTFQIGANGVEDQRLTVTVEDMSSKALKIDNIDVSKQDNANDAINSLDDAIKAVSTQRAKLGAVQNRLEHTVNSLNTANENMTASESQIRDTDMAAEMIKYTKSNILQQASQSMLAQANQQPQGVLQLLG